MKPSPGSCRAAPPPVRAADALLPLPCSSRFTFNCRPKGTRRDMSNSISKYRRVLIPIDLMPGRQMTAPAVRQLVDTSDAEITLLHVVDSQPWTGRSGHTLRLMTELEI